MRNERGDPHSKLRALYTEIRAIISAFAEAARQLDVPTEWPVQYRRAVD